MHSIPSRPHHRAGNLNGETGEMEGVREAGEGRPEEGGGGSKRVGGRREIIYRGWVGEKVID